MDNWHSYVGYISRCTLSTDCSIRRRCKSRRCERARGGVAREKGRRSENARTSLSSRSCTRRVRAGALSLPGRWRWHNNQ